MTDIKNTPDLSITSAPPSTDNDFNAPVRDSQMIDHQTDAATTDALLLNLDGYDGPIDVLLELARHQKVDLTKISILQLTRQFLAFIDRAKELRLDLAAEYLVMAAWLAYLKSRLLLPKEPSTEDEPSAQAMADALAYQLRRLEAMQKAATALMSRTQRNRDFFARGFIEPNETKVQTVWTATLYDMLKAYGDIRARKEKGKTYELPQFHLMSAEDALSRITKMLGALPKTGPHTAWTTLIAFLPDEAKNRNRDFEEGATPVEAGVQSLLDPGLRRDDSTRDDDALYLRSSLASLLTATLEMAKQGTIELRQDGAFRPIYVRGIQKSEAA